MKYTHYLIITLLLVTLTTNQATMAQTPVMTRDFEIIKNWSPIEGNYEWVGCMVWMACTC
jgi:hypothetical protein